jgi:hypothetical protein
MGRSPKEGLNWDSLVHYWNDWSDSYLYQATDYPRLMIRFEDTSFHPKEVMRQVCQCGGAQTSKTFNYLVDEAKWKNQKHAQNNMVSATIRYGMSAGRYHNMTEEDNQLARSALNPELIKAFYYQQDDTSMAG